MIEELHTQIEAVQRELVNASQADQTYQISRHRARLEDLIDIAARHGIEVSQWVDPTLLTPTTPG